VRKLLLSALAVGAITPAAGAALAADHTKTNSTEESDPAASHALQDRTYKARAQHTVHAKHVRVERKRTRRMHKKQAAAVPAVLQTIAACESHDNPRAIGGGGAFRGKYQFDYGTWASVGGSGDPAAAPEAEQDKRAAMLLARSGSSPWPVCGR
jgi:Transglycosylase-like domain